MEENGEDNTPGFWEYIEDFLDDSNNWFERANKEIPFEQWTYESNGKKGNRTKGNRPRVSAYYSIYSSDIPSVVAELFSLINEQLLHNEKFKHIELKEPLDSVLIHKYRTGFDYINWHSDREAKDTYICGLSFGGVRKLGFRMIKKHEKKWHYDLASGSLYIMYPGCQNYFQHRIMKTVAKVQPAPRISFTFRQEKETNLKLMYNITK